MEKSQFINEAGNKITVKVKKCNGVGTNFKTKEKVKFKGVSLSLIGPTSESTNNITAMEAIELYKCLEKYLRKNKYIKN